MNRRKDQKDVPESYKDASRGERLQKVLANAGVASRRDAEELITAGRVTVNGRRVNALPAWVDPVRDRVAVDGQPIRRSSGSRKGAGSKLYIALHKPRRAISTTSDELGRVTVLDLVDLPEHIDKRLYPVGRLDADSTGLILLTNDGELANRLTHPRYEVAKQYIVSVRGKLSPADVEKLREGIYLAQRQPRARGSAKKAAMASVKLLGHTTDRRSGDRTQLEVTLREGQNREIRRMLARLGYKVRRLQRTAIGPLKLKGLGIGQWRMLESSEVTALYRAAGLEKDRPGGRKGGSGSS